MYTLCVCRYDVYVCHLMPQKYYCVTFSCFSRHARICLCTLNLTNYSLHTCPMWGNNSVWWTQSQHVFWYITFSSLAATLQQRGSSTAKDLDYNLVSPQETIIFSKLMVYNWCSNQAPQTKVNDNSRRYRGVSDDQQIKNSFPSRHP